MSQILIWPPTAAVTSWLSTTNMALIALVCALNVFNEPSPNPHRRTTPSDPPPYKTEFTENRQVMWVGAGEGKLMFGVLGGEAVGEEYPLVMLMVPEVLSELNNGKDWMETLLDVDHNRTVPSRPAEQSDVPVWESAETPGACAATSDKQCASVQRQCLIRPSAATINST